MEQESLFSNDIIDPVRRTALFSPCRKYRYILKIVWAESKGLLHLLMLNQSTADEVQNDPTIERQIERAKRLGYGGLIVTNLFAWRSTDPSVLPGLEDPVGPENDTFILNAVQQARMTICGWGEHGSVNGRSARVLHLLHGYKLWCLKLNQSGQPQHPLYIGYDVAPKEFHA